ncbi:hypothetical protein A2U01_0056098 [Trifolium medium]|uniref:Uncharacterized protein n=1 Tax=Trifolium medium TaxID=97028 RepID=A0A392RF82_9FABA|nr:hypothetical protein [Trifolium medium]
MAPGEKEDDFTRGLSTRAELVDQLTYVLGNLTAAAKLGFNNAVAQLEVINPGLQTTGMGFWRKVVDGQVVLPPENATKETDDFLEEEDDMEPEQPATVEPRGDQLEGQDESG